MSWYYTSSYNHPSQFPPFASCPFSSKAPITFPTCTYLLKPLSCSVWPVSELITLPWGHLPPPPCGLASGHCCLWEGKGARQSSEADSKENMVKPAQPSWKPIAEHELWFYSKYFSVNRGGSERHYMIFSQKRRDLSFPPGFLGPPLNHLTWGYPKSDCYPSWVGAFLFPSTSPHAPHFHNQCWGTLNILPICPETQPHFPFHCLFNPLGFPLPKFLCCRKQGGSGGQASIGFQILLSLLASCVSLAKGFSAHLFHYLENVQDSINLTGLPESWVSKRLSLSSCAHRDGWAPAAYKFPLAHKQKSMQSWQRLREMTSLVSTEKRS